MRNGIHIIGAILLLTACNPCANTLIQELESPDGEIRTVVFERDCGATTGFSTQISLLPKNAPVPKEGGNTFIADTDHGEAPAGPWGGPEVELEWTDNRALTIRHHPKARIFKATNNVIGVSVTYEKMNGS